MTLSTACPKPPAREKKKPKWLPRSSKPLKRTAIKRSTTPIKQRNEQRIAKRHAAYTAHLRSVEYLQLRYARYLLDDGYCQCEWCVKMRDVQFSVSGFFEVLKTLPDNINTAEPYNKIPVHFTKSGSEPWRRIRGFHTHHARYDLTHPKITDLRTMYPHHHLATEAKYSTRRRFLKSK